MDHSRKHRRPTTAPANPTDLLESSPVGAVLRHESLSLAAKGLAAYVLCQPRGRLFTRAELERLSLDGGSPALDSALHELTRGGLLVSVPPGERPCCASLFQLRED